MTDPTPTPEPAPSGRLSNADRDEQIVRYWAAGFSWKRIGAKVGLSPRRVRDILQREHKRYAQKCRLELDAVRGVNRAALARRGPGWPGS